MKLAVALIVALALLPTRAWAGDGALTGAELDAYVDSVIEAYGGAKQVAKLARHRIEGKVAAHMRGGSGTFRRDFVAPDSLRVELVYADRDELRVLAGEQGWRGDAASLLPAQGMPHTAMVYQMVRASAPWFIHQRRAQLVHAGDGERDEVKHRVLRLKWSDALTVDFWVDDTTRLVTKVEGTLTAGRASMTFATHYTKFERVGGLMVPHTEESVVRGQLTGTATVTKVTLGAKRLGPFAPGKAARKR